MRWTEAEDKRLRDMYPTTSNRVIAEKLGRSYSSIKNRSISLGLKKSPEYLENEKPGCFKPGHETWNKGIHFVSGGRSAETRYPAGHKPHNTKPIGSIRETRDGILQQKVADTGYPPRDWKSVHSIRWEEYHGRPVPDGHVVRFRDGDRRNFDEDNLVLVTRAENAILNKLYKTEGLPEGGFDVMLSLARIKLVSKRREREVA